MRALPLRRLVLVLAVVLVGMIFALAAGNADDDDEPQAVAPTPSPTAEVAAAPATPTATEPAVETATAPAPATASPTIAPSPTTAPPATPTARATATSPPAPATATPPPPTAVALTCFLDPTAGAGLGIYRIDADGSNPCRLTDSGAIESNPVPSPDGNMIAFVRLGDGFVDVFVMDSFSGVETRITDAAGNDSGPSWMSDSELAWVSERESLGQQGGHVFSVDVDDPDNQRQLEDELDILFDLAVSPDGEWIAFSSNSEAQLPGSLFVARTDGSELRSLGVDGISLWPSWSPDGRRIAFQSDMSGDRDIFVINADGSGLVSLTNNSADDRAPVWSPDGEQLVFASNADGDFDLYVVNADGSGLRQLTNFPGQDHDPAWSPDGEFIYYTNARGWTG